MSGSCATSWIGRVNGSEPREQAAPRVPAVPKVAKVASGWQAFPGAAQRLHSSGAVSATAGRPCRSRPGSAPRATDHVDIRGRGVGSRRLGCRWCPAAGSGGSTSAACHRAVLPDRRQRPAPSRPHQGPHQGPAQGPVAGVAAAPGRRAPSARSGSTPQRSQAPPTSRSAPSPRYRSSPMPLPVTAWRRCYWVLQPGWRNCYTCGRCDEVVN